MSADQVALYTIQGITLGAQYALVAMSLSLVYRMSAMVNFVAGDLAAVGALLGGVTIAGNLGLPLGIGLLAAIAIGALLSGIVSYALLPPRRCGAPAEDADHTLTWVIAAVAASILIQQLASVLWGSEVYAVPPLVDGPNVMIADIPVRRSAILLVVVAVLVAVVLDVILRKTRWGMRVRAAGADRVGAAVSGIDFRIVYLQVFLVGGAIAGLAGMLIAPLASASAFFGFALTIKGFIAGALGGLGSIRGAIVAALLLGLVESYAGAAFGAQWQDVVALGLLIAVLVVRPTGIMPTRVTRTV